MTESSPRRAARVLLCVGGGIAAYKTPELVRALVAADLEVRVVMTPAAHAFVTELSLAAVSRHQVRTQVLDAAQEGQIGHIELADWADVVVVAPATADLLARAAAGMADDLATVCLLATLAPVLWAPAMNTNMWQHPATQDNLARLQARGAHFVGPDRGALACGWIGPGRMIDPPILVAEVLQRLAPRPWAGRRVLVSAGPTRTYLDPVRFLTNASTGTMGFALAAQAHAQGADVTLVAGPVQLPTPTGVTRVDVETAAEMLAVMDGQLAQGPWDLVAMVAAVSDVATDAQAGGKLDKQALLERLAAQPWRLGVDVLQTLVARHGARVKFLGFAAQTSDAQGAQLEAELVRLGEEKMVRKGVDALFVNPVGVSDTGFGASTNGGWLLLRSGGDVSITASGVPMPKPELARWLLDKLFAWVASER